VLPDCCPIRDTAPEGGAPEPGGGSLRRSAVPQADPLLLSFLDTRDAPCPVCDYNLRGLKVDRCPECAAHLHLRVGSENTRLGPWLGAVLSFSLAVGFDAVMGLLVSIIFTVSLFAPPQTVPPIVRQQHIILLVGFVGLALACGGAILMLVKRRRRWMMMPRRRQWRIAAVIFVLVFLVHLLAGFMMARML
jgi:hypothetical protein